ncbi:MAG: GGDEF domain-containing phosphodiesterase [Lachnospiraceae bacterium]|nr:GGDEF domain-containing phosphodiesterase [Lachnospiraceae bacterium]
MKNKEVYRKIRKTNTWGNLISLLVFFSVTMMLIVITAVAFLNYMVEAKLIAQYQTFQTYAAMSEDAIGKDAEQKTLFSGLDRSGYDYLILDENGAVLHSCGEDTRDSEAIQARLGFLSRKLMVYKDRDQTYLNVGDSGYINVEYTRIMDWFRATNERMDDLAAENPGLFISVMTGDEPMEDDNTGHFEDSFETSGQGVLFPYSATTEIDGEILKATEELKAPLWMGLPIGETGCVFVGKSYFSLDMNEITLFLEVAGFLVIIVVIMILVLLGISISGIRRQRRVVNYFFTDPVTVGHNQMYFQIKGEQMLRKSRYKTVGFAVVNLVFVNYRNYVVCHSVAQGELLLKQIYQVIGKNIRSREMVAHMSSSDFGLLLRYDNQENLRMRLEGLIRQIESVDPGHNFAFQAGVSLIEVKRNDSGKALHRHRLDLSEEYNNACTARSVMADSEDSGIAFFDEKIVADRRWQDAVIERQKSAVANEEFKVYYQPKYSPVTNRLSGAEALIRWQSPDLGFVTPYKFIPIFEKNGFITEIDHYMISHVARDQKRWLDQGYECVPVSVNVSRAHFIESDLAEQIRDMVDAEGCPHHLVEIELTESAFFDDKKAMIDTITRLKEYGFAVSMDDFGAGYSSLNSLKDMPLDVLKLDAEFFRGGAGDRGQIVVSEAIRLAKSLNMRTVAEGVEIAEQADFLAAEGCDMIQGYFYAKPMESGDYEEKMKAGYLDPREKTEN